MRKSKKSMIMNISLVIITLFILSISFINLMSQSNKLLEDPLSYRSVDIIESAQKGETLRFYLFQYFNRNIETTINSIISNNGFLPTLPLFNQLSQTIPQPCGFYDNVNYWSSQTIDCYPEILNSLEGYVNIKTNSLVSSHPFFDILDSGEYYSLSVADSSELLFLSKNPSPISNEGGVYYARPSFKVQTSLNLVKLFSLENNVRELKEKCSRDADIPACVDDYILTNNLDWNQVNTPPNNFHFTVPLGITTPTSPNIDFSLYIPS